MCFQLQRCMIIDMYIQKLIHNQIHNESIPLEPMIDINKNVWAAPISDQRVNLHLPEVDAMTSVHCKYLALA